MVSLNKSQSEQGNAISAVQVTLAPPPVKNDIATPFDVREMANLGPMVNNMYSDMLTAQLNVYNKPGIIDQLAKITKDYYEALIKTGFIPDAALKIITSKQLISVDGGLK